MKDIIIVKKKECFINSEKLAELSENKHKAVKELIAIHQTVLGEFGVLTIETSKPSSKGGRPKITYLLNEQQATLLTTFMRNSKKVIKFKKKLVEEFFRMRSYIQKQETIRLAGIETRKTLTDRIQESGENGRMHGHGYSTYTRLIYSLTGLTETHKEWKMDHPDKKLKFRDYLVPEDLKKIELAESLIKPLIEMEKQYSEIKDTLEPIFKNTPSQIEGNK